LLGVCSTARLQLIDSRADAKLGAEGPIEVRNVAETSVERNIEDSGSRCACYVCEPHRGGPQASAKNVLMRREARHALESAKEVVGA
jgi:hypothetical protein